MTSRSPKKPQKALIDTGASHNYLASTKVERLDLVLEKSVVREEELFFLSLGVEPEQNLRVGSSSPLERNRKSFEISLTTNSSLESGMGTAEGSGGVYTYSTRLDW